MTSPLKTTILCICIVLLLGSAGLASDMKDEVLASALAFTEIIDSSNAQAAYWSSSPLLRRANDEQEWIKRTDRIQALLGKVQGRALQQIRHVTSFARLPDDNYLIVVFDSRTEYKAEATEVVQLHQVNEIWQVCLYSIH